MTMSEPHQIQSSETSKLIAADRLCEQLWDEHKDDLIHRVTALNYSFQQCRQLLIYKSMVLEWHMRPRMAVNPDRYFLKRLYEVLTTEQRLRLDSSLHYCQFTSPAPAQAGE